MMCHSWRFDTREYFVYVKVSWLGRLPLWDWLCFDTERNWYCIAANIILGPVVINILRKFIPIADRTFSRSGAHTLIRVQHASPTLNRCLIARYYGIVFFDDFISFVSASDAGTV